MQTSSPGTARRSFLSRLLAGLGAGGALTLGAAPLSAQAPSGTTPLRHAQDDWMDALPRGHRLVFDTTTPEGFADAITFANNFFNANQSGYGLKDGDIGIVIVARHGSTAFGWNDKVWAKYGKTITERTKLDDPRTKQAPVGNVFNAPVQGLGNRGTTIDDLVKRGVRFAVCQMATRGLSAQLAQATGGNADAVFAEISTSLVTEARLVSAGIVAVSRAQERGYTLVTA